MTNNNKYILTKRKKERLVLYQVKERIRVVSENNITFRYKIY